MRHFQTISAVYGWFTTRYLHGEWGEMFNKKPRRNFRQRKDSSSDDEDQQKNTKEGDENPEKTAPAVVNKPLKASQARGITCSSKREATPPKPDSSDGEDGETLEVTDEREERKKDKEENKKKEPSILSFSDDKEGEKCKCCIFRCIFFLFHILLTTLEQRW